jgi:hypothetical protein
MRGFRTEAQQAELLGKHVRTLRRWRRLRIGPAWTNNGIGVLYNDDWTRTWLEGGKVEMPRTLSTSKRWRGRRGAT